MMGLKQLFSRRNRRHAVSGCLAATIVGMSFMAWGQDQSAATPKDVIFARKTLMVVIADNMQEIEAMTGSGKIDLARGPCERKFDRGDVDGLPASLPARPPIHGRRMPRATPQPTLSLIRAFGKNIRSSTRKPRPPPSMRSTQAARKTRPSSRKTPRTCV